MVDVGTVGEREVMGMNTPDLDESFEGMKAM
jgi:hypothetical protein